MVHYFFTQIATDLKYNNAYNVRSWCDCLSIKLTTEAKFGFVQIINIWICSLENSHKRNPRIIIEKNNQIYWGDLEIYFFLLYRFKLVLKVTYLAWLHI